jgi:alkanesulfonate monooxygenase SsuD/methylene tetrahydromethanopterin reductase-like flavin-dependent oxidoreductase (luciferase family)
MRFGWLTLAHSPSPQDDTRAIFEQLEQATFAEATGFHGVWLTEHNFTGESVYADPIPFAAALAMRTERIRIGFAVIQMALRQPVRLATQLSLLDNLTRGRLDIGVGRGSIFNEYEFIGYGLRSDDSRERMAEALDVMTKGLDGDAARPQGEILHGKPAGAAPCPRAAAAPADLA